MRALSQYLLNYAEPESAQLENFFGNYIQGLTIPCYRESADDITRALAFTSANAGTLLVLCLNRPDDDSDYRWCETLLALPQFNPQKKVWCAPTTPMVLYTMALYAMDNNSAVLLVDRCVHGAPIDRRQGVGLARKIGADILCALIERGHIHSPWIAITDADAHLPANYFSALLNSAKKISAATAALLFPFKHIFTDSTVAKLPTLLYEFSLHYYVAGIAWAGSPYAYHTLGSTLALHYTNYAKVRGFPKRAGAEDFYLLNKIAKTGGVQSLSSPTIALQARESTRVPFGTGPAVTALAAQTDTLAMALYHPLCFHYLQLLLRLIQQQAFIRSDLPANAEQLISAADNHQLNAEILLELVDFFKVDAALAHSYQHGKQAATRQQHLQHWFDGFKTLKCIHYLREHYFPSISYREWLQQKDTDQLINPRMRQLIIDIAACAPPIPPTPLMQLQPALKR